MAPKPIDFAGLAAALLARADSLVPNWLPQGTQRNGRWYCGDFDGGAGESANVNLETGQWIDNGGGPDDRGGDLISLYARIRGLNNGEAAREIMRDMGWERPDEREQRRSSSAAPAPQNSPAPAPPWGVDDDAPAADKPKRVQKWRAVVPVPAHAPAPRFVHAFKDKKAGEWVEMEAVAHWAYRRGEVLFGYVARFERVNSEGELTKDTLPFTWCENLEDGRGHQRWHARQWEEPRPLYLPAGDLSTDGRLVVVVEGEKCAKAGHDLLGDVFDFVAWPGGCKTWTMADWTWLAGRSVVLWPDCDAQHEFLTRAEREADVDRSTKPLLPADKQPGMMAMLGLAARLASQQGCSVRLCQIPAPGTVADGWDIADAIAQGWAAEQVQGMIDAALPVQLQGDVLGGVQRGEPKGNLPLPGACAGPVEEAGTWRDALIKSPKGAPLPVRDNVVLALDGRALPSGGWLPGAPEVAGLISYNEFTNDVHKMRATPWGTSAGVWEEVDELELGNWLSREHWLPPMSRQTLEEAVSMVARRHRHHPARERIEALRGTWDGTPRCGSWLADCCLKGGHAGAAVPLQKYLARVGTWVLMAVVARVLTPGCKFDYMLILEGGQGLGKSTLARTLGMDWFADTGLVLGDKDSYQNLQGVLVYEWGELDSLTRSEVTKVKQFISSQKDRFRASFDRRPKDYPRQVVFVGTTNESHYLTDPTGNRRFWPVRVTRQIDLDWMRANMDQLLAEALQYVEAGERFHPNQAEQVALFDDQQRERAVENALESAIRRYLYDEHQKLGLTGTNGSLVDEITLSDLLSALGITVDKQTQVMTKQASAALSRLGWERGRASAAGGVKVRPWVYRRPDPADDNAGVEALLGATSMNRQMRGDDEREPNVCPF
jgi:putative DNA primase/helicase